MPFFQQRAQWRNAVVTQSWTESVTTASTHRFVCKMQQINTIKNVIVSGSNAPKLPLPDHGCWEVGSLITLVPAVLAVISHPEQRIWIKNQFEFTDCHSLCFKQILALIRCSDFGKHLQSRFFFLIFRLLRKQPWKAAASLRFHV